MPYNAMKHRAYVPEKNFMEAALQLAEEAFAAGEVPVGAVVVKDVPPNSTVVGIPGHIVVRDGQRVADEAADAATRHENLPDPTEERLSSQSERLAALEREFAQLRAQLEEGTIRNDQREGE